MSFVAPTPCRKRQNARIVSDTNIHKKEVIENHFAPKYPDCCSKGLVWGICVSRKDQNSPDTSRKHPQLLLPLPSRCSCGRRSNSIVGIAALQLRCSNAGVEPLVEQLQLWLAVASVLAAVAVVPVQALEVKLSSHTCLSLEAVGNWSEFSVMRAVAKQLLSSSVPCFRWLMVVMVVEVAAKMVVQIEVLGGRSMRLMAVRFPGRLVVDMSACREGNSG